jgi:adenosine deaminase
VVGDLQLERLPKAELHLHLDGSMHIQTAVELGRDIGMSLSTSEARSRMVAPRRCSGQAELLTYFDLPLRLLQSERALRRVAAELVADLAADGVSYAEVRWAPRLHLLDGLSVTAVIEAVAGGVAEATAELGQRAPLVGLIVTAMRSHPPAANVALAHAAAEYGPPVVGFDLAGDEAFPAPPHAAALAAAASAGLGISVHAGEVPDPGHVLEALDLGATRIAHGVTAAEDASVVRRLRKLEVTLDLCPTSNVQAGIVSDMAAHPVARLHRAGVSVTISTDDRTVSDTTLSAELARTAAAVGLTPPERAFASQEAIEALLAEAAAAWAHWAVSAETRAVRPAEGVVDELDRGTELPRRSGARPPRPASSGR